MIPGLLWFVVLATWTPVGGAGAGPVEIVLDRDNIEVTTDTLVRPGSYAVPDADGNGVVHITADGVTVDFQGAELVGFTDPRQPDACTGTGVVITGEGVTLRNAKVRGFKVGILAHGAARLTVEDVDVSGNFRQRLGSTPQREDPRDWLSPHGNDERQWPTAYGAGLCVERSDSVVIRRVRARAGQNGIILDRVDDSRVCDNDCSFLSGWGLALWRSSRNLICRNAFDFCIRGYSHGVYNRGQDSAGILIFEQCCGNIIAENSATHCGDGVFGFAGLEALSRRHRAGSNDNLLIGNDFSYAAAHGIEMTFGFGNRFIANRLVGNAICGVWAGYSQDTLIAGNVIAENGHAGYRVERGGVNIEHGSRNVIRNNMFRGNSCGVFLWSDEDARLMNEPWVQANHRGSTDNRLLANTFEGDAIAVQLRETVRTTLAANTMTDVGVKVDADEVSRPEQVDGIPRPWQPPPYPTCGETRPVGAREHLRGRERIVVTEWGRTTSRSRPSAPRAFWAGGRPSSRCWLRVGGSELPAWTAPSRSLRPRGTCPGRWPSL